MREATPYARRLSTHVSRLFSDLSTQGLTRAKVPSITSLVDGYHIGKSATRRSLAQDYKARNDEDLYRTAAADSKAPAAGARPATGRQVPRYHPVVRRTVTLYLTHDQVRPSLDRCTVLAAPL